jgi:hypothetical protein
MLASPRWLILQDIVGKHVFIDNIYLFIQKELFQPEHKPLFYCTYNDYIPPEGEFKQ